MDIKQHGVRKCTLYENKNIVYHYPQQLRHDLVDSVSTDGIIIEITQCERIDFDFELAPSQNEILEYTFYLRFFYAGFGVENITLLDKLDNPNGFIALIEMQDNETKYVVPAALKIEPMNIQNQSNAAFNYVMKNEVPTLQPLYEYSESATLIPRNGLDGEWLFSGNADDTSGEGNDATFDSAVLTIDRFDKLDSAYTLISNMDISSVGHLPTISISLWFNTNSSNNMGLIGKSDFNNTQGDYNITLTGSGIRWRINNGVYSIYNTVNYNDGVWHHLVCSFGSGILRMYYDNVEIAISSDLGISLNDLYSIIRLAQYYAPSYGLIGILDDVRIYNIVLTQSEIDILYNE